MKEKPDFLFSAGWRKNIDSFSKIRCKEENSAQGVSGNDTKKSWLYCATHSFEQFSFGICFIQTYSEVSIKRPVLLNDLV